MRGLRILAPSVLAVTSAASAQPVVTDFYPQSGGLGTQITVHVSDFPMLAAPRTAAMLRLYLGGLRLGEVRPTVDARNHRVVFDLQPTDATRATLTTLPGGERLALTVGWDGEAPLRVTARPIDESDVRIGERRFRLEPAVRGIWPARVRAGEVVTVGVLGLTTMRPPDGPESLQLYLDGQPVPGLRPVAVNRRTGEVRFRLDRTEATSRRWRELLVSGAVAVSVGGRDGAFAARQPDGAPVLLRMVADGTRWWTVAAVLVALAGLLAVGGASSDLIRNRELTGSTPADGPHAYSLARCQMAVWTAIAVGGLLYVWARTGELTITAQLLVLMGISAATTIGATLVDSSKQAGTVAAVSGALATATQAGALATTARVQQAATTAGGPSDAIPSASVRAIDRLAAAQVVRAAAIAGEATPPRTTGSVLRDVLSDHEGISLPRLQALVWTVVLGAYVVHELITTLQMPTLSTELLTLMGVSGSTYVAFKLPERRQSLP